MVIKMIEIFVKTTSIIVEEELTFPQLEIEIAM